MSAADCICTRDACWHWLQGMKCESTCIRCAVNMHVRVVMAQHSTVCQSMCYVTCPSVTAISDHTQKALRTVMRCILHQDADICMPAAANQIRGSLPVALTALSSLQALQLPFNSLTGELVICQAKSAHAIKEIDTARLTCAWHPHAQAPYHLSCCRCQVCAFLTWWVTMPAMQHLGLACRMCNQSRPPSKSLEYCPPKCT